MCLTAIVRLRVCSCTGLRVSHVGLYEMTRVNTFRSISLCCTSVHREREAYRHKHAAPGLRGPSGLVLPLLALVVLHQQAIRRVGLRRRKIRRGIGREKSKIRSQVAALRFFSAFLIICKRITW